MKYLSIKVMENKSHFEFVEIVLDGNKSRYQAGEDVFGVIKFALKGSAVVDRIKICLICVSEVKVLVISNTNCMGSYVYNDKKRLMHQSFALPKMCKFLPFSFLFYLN